MNLLQRHPVSAAPAEESHSGSWNSRNLWILFLLGLFATSLALTSWFNLSYPHPEVTYVGDAGGYIEEARLVFNLHDLCSKFLALRPWTAMTLDDGIKFSWLLQHMPELRLNGPVFPVFIAANFMAMGEVIGESCNGWTISNWFVPLTTQCLFVAINCVLTAVAGSRLWDKRVGVTAGLLSLAYPGFIVNSGRPTTEMLGCTLVLAIMVLSSYLSRQKNFLLTLLLGLTLTVLQLSRSAMILLWLMVPVTTFIGRSKRDLLIAACALLCGAACMLGPWSVWQQARFGNVVLIVDRASRYNLFVGQNVERQGWITMPYFLPEWATRSSSGRVLWRELKQDPVGWTAFQLDKPPRMVKSVWNDFRQAIGPFTIEWQNLFHQSLLLMAMAGFSIAFWCRNKDTMLPRLVLLEIVAMHAVYFCFAPVARYNSTAIPGLILLAAAGLVSAVSAISSKNQKERLASWLLLGGIVAFSALLRAGNPLYSGQLFSSTNPMLVEGCLLAAKAAGLGLFTAGVLHFCTVHRLASPARASILVLTLLLAPFVALPLRCYGRVGERALPFNAPIERNILLSKSEAEFAKNNQCYLAIDADSALNLNNHIAISINDEPVIASVISGIRLTESHIRTEAAPNYHYRELIFNCLASAADTDVLHLRQWFYIPVPAKVIEKASGSFRIKITPTSPKAQGSIFARFQPLHGNYKLPSFSLYSFDKAFYGVETDAGLNDPRLDRQVTISSTPAEPRLNQSQLVPNVLIVAAPKPSYWKTANNHLELLSQKEVQTVPLTADKADFTVTIPFRNSPQLEETVLLRAQGTLRTKGKEHRAGLDVVVELENGDKRTLYSALAVPRVITDGQHFDVAVPLARPAFEDRKIKNVHVILHANSPLNNYYNVQEQNTNSYPTSFDDVSVECLTVPSNPCTGKARIY